MSYITNVSDNQLPLFHLFAFVMGGWGVQCVFCDAETAPELFDSDRDGPWS